MNPTLIQANKDMMAMMSSFTRLDINYYRRMFFYNIVAGRRSFLLKMIEDNQKEYDELIEYFNSWSEISENEANYMKVKQELYSIRGDYYKKN